jgi:hypothetical protein
MKQGCARSHPEPHQAQLGNGGIGECLFNVVLEKGKKGVGSFVWYLNGEGRITTVFGCRNYEV